MTEELAALVRKHSGTMYRKMLVCSQDVSDALAEASIAAPPRMPWEPDLSALMGINIVISPDSPPGTWRLIQHDHCEVTGGEYPGHVMTVRHGNCTVLAENPEPR